MAGFDVEMSEPPMMCFSDLHDLSVLSDQELEHTSQLSDSFAALLFSEKMSDVVFVLDESERIMAHRIILAARSNYFRALLFGGMRESEEREVLIKNTSTPAFKAVLKYAYTGKLPMKELSDDAMEILFLAHQYELLDLQNAVSDYLQSITTIGNLPTILNAAHMYCLEDLIEFCMDFADRNATNVLKFETFGLLSPDVAVQLLLRDSFCASEIEIFRAICSVLEARAQEENKVRSFLKCVRLPLITQSDLLSVVRNSKLIDSDAILDAIAQQSAELLNPALFRGFKFSDENVATAALGAVASVGNGKPCGLLSEAVSLSERCTSHSYSSSEGILIELGNPHIINKIVMTLWSREQHYSYYIEVSMEKKSWNRVIDYSKYSCHGLQQLYFTPVAVKFIRVVGVGCSPKKFSICTFEAVFTTEPFVVDTETNIMVPDFNVAASHRQALVVEGVSRCRNTLLNGDVDSYDWDSGYTCHQIGGGGITIQLPQPFIISTMRILLWDCDDRFYSYYVEVSDDQLTWKKIVDRTRMKCRSWQYLVFEPTRAVFIRLTGTRNSSNEVFHVVHLECPADETAEKPPPSFAIPDDVSGEGISGSDSD
ncbi:unnamed protein product [Caenorhabditis auriculariae]|uniref:BTB domain-containing protein n=1 Tax=Caenorhabditis auriculariae TaxID=2777116 RepID=A0A8S1GU58_9PELO|nr:unnamed protein product [Caenorhabditis auriculariae]